jgi:hypothetical protein
MDVIRRRLIDDLKLEIAEPMSPDPQDPIDVGESWLRRWPPYHPPPNGRYWHDGRTTLVEDLSSHMLYIVRSPTPRQQ